MFNSRSVSPVPLFLAVVGCVASASPLVHAQSVSHGVSAGLFKVVQHDTQNNATSVTVSSVLSVNDLLVRPGSNRGDFNVQAGLGFSDDVGNGVLMACVAENGRDNGEVAYPGTNFCTVSIDYVRTGGSAGGYSVPVFNAPAGAEFNINFAAAWFPYDKWIGGFARNSSTNNGGPNDLFTGSAGLIPGTHYVDQGGGVSIVNLKSFGIDSRTNGVLLVTHGKGEDNLALSAVNSNDGTWTVYVKDSGTDQDVWEQDPVAFVFVPKTNATVISGRFSGDGSPMIYSGSSPAFSVANLSAGVWRLTIPGHSPGSGVLVISAEAGTGSNQDNIVSYQPDGNGWLIQSRDLPGNPPGLQTPSGAVASFVFIPAAVTSALVAPGDGAAGVALTPSLQTRISSNAPSNVSVSFYGRKASVAGPDFTMAVLPDTQFYTGSLNGGTPQMFSAQTEWIITNRVSRNIAYVAHLGDISQNGDLRSGGVSNIGEWLNATNAMYRLEDPNRTSLLHGIPYGMAVGNHDQEPIGTADGTTIFYNQFFGIPHFANKPYYGGHYGTNNDNHVDFFSASGVDFVVVYFEYDNNANPAVLAWANNVLQTNAHRHAIIVTHNFGNTSTPISFSAQGSAIYNALKTNSNLFLMLGGHVTGEGARVDTYNGQVVRTFVQDFQGWTNGGNGYMRTYEFSPKNNQVVVQTFSAWTGQYETDENSEFFFDHNMQAPATPFQLIGVVNNVSPGAVAGLPWPGRESASTYDWYATVTDSSGNTSTGPIWQFSTRTNRAPTVEPRIVAVAGDTTTNLTLLATDADGDPLTFQTNSLPTRGLLENFNPVDGSFTYRPVHGFSGLDQFSFQASDDASTSAVATLYLNVVAPADTNNNGLPDYWESRYGLTDGDADPDGDGRSNRDEYGANTNPTNSQSVLRIDSVAVTNGVVKLSWSGVGSTRYRIQYSEGGTNGSFSGVFTDIVQSLDLELEKAPTGTNAPRTFVDDLTLSGGYGTNRSRFYRLKVVQ